MVSFEYDLTYSGPAFPIAEITITGHSNISVARTAYLDTGADATVIPLPLLKQIDARRLDRALLEIWMVPDTKSFSILFPCRLGRIRFTELKLLQTIKHQKSFWGAMH